MPIVTSTHVFVHMPKTGGCWISGLLAKECAGVEHGWPHAPPSALPEDLRRGRTTFGVLREPRSWYESWYLHCLESQRGREALLAWGRGSVAFDSVLAGVTRAREVTELPRDFGGLWRFDPDGPDPRPSWLRSEGGLWTWLANGYGFLDPEQVQVLLDFETLHRDTERLLSRPVDLTAHPPENTRGARPAQPSAPTWDPVTRQRVDDADGPAWRRASGRLRQGI